jgi:hypothetical protein
MLFGPTSVGARVINKQSVEKDQACVFSVALFSRAPQSIFMVDRPERRRGRTKVAFHDVVRLSPSVSSGCLRGSTGRFLIGGARNSILMPDAVPTHCVRRDRHMLEDALSWRYRVRVASAARAHGERVHE